MSASFFSPANDCEDGRPDAVTFRAIGLLRVLKGFVRGVYGLGLAVSDVIARRTHEGADPHSANSGCDLNAAMQMLRRALQLADALRARLRTPTVIAFLKRPGAVRIGSSQPQADTQAELNDTMRQLTELRRYGERCRRWIAGLSDREVLTRIYADLTRAAAMLGDTALAERIEKLGCAASALLGDEAEEAPDAARPADRVTPNRGSAPMETADARPPRANERAPP